MPGRDTAVRQGADLATLVRALAAELGLACREEVKVGRRLWGAVRKIDFVLTHPDTKKTIGLECKFQKDRGSAEEKIPSTIQDISAWPIAGLVVFDGPGFSDNMRSFLLASGKAVELCDLRDWLVLYFGLI